MGFIPIIRVILKVQDNLYRTENKLIFTCILQGSEYEATVNSVHTMKQMPKQGFTNSKSLHCYASIQIAQEIGSTCIFSSKSVARLRYLVSHIKFKMVENHEEFVIRINIIVKIIQKTDSFRSQLTKTIYTLMHAKENKKQCEYLRKIIKELLSAMKRLCSTNLLKRLQTYVCFL